jgi:hypothetical protein
VRLRVRIRSACRSEARSSDKVIYKTSLDRTLMSRACSGATSSWRPFFVAEAGLDFTVSTSGVPPSVRAISIILLSRPRLLFRSVGNQLWNGSYDDLDLPTTLRPGSWATDISDPGLVCGLTEGEPRGWVFDIHARSRRGSLPEFTDGACAPVAVNRGLELPCARRAIQDAKGEFNASKPARGLAFKGDTLDAGPPTAGGNRIPHIAYLSRGS